MANQNFRVKNGLDVGIGGTIITTTGIGSVGIGSTQPASTLVVSAPSGYTGNVIEAKLNGTSLVALKPNGTQGSIVVTSTGFNNSVLDLGGSSGIIHFSSTLWGFRTAGAYRLAFAHNEGTRIQSSDSYGWSSSTIDRPTADIDVRLFRDDAGVLAQRNAGVGQTFRIYNTYTSASEYERAYLGWNNNTFEIGVGTAGISTARSISLVGAAGSNTGDTLQPLQINQTWTTGTGIATALTLDVTDTSSSSSSKLLDLRVGGSSKYSITKTGKLIVPDSNSWTNNSALGFNVNNVGIMIPAGNTGIHLSENQGCRFGRFDRHYLTINSSTSLDVGNLSFLTGSTTLWRLYADAANVLAQRNAGVGQTFRIYNTYTDASNYERAQVGWTTNTFIVGTEKGSAGGTARQLELQTDGTTRVAITTDGYVGIGSTLPGSTLVVNAPSGYTGNLLDAQVGGSSRFKINSNTNPTITISGSPTISSGIFKLDVNYLDFIKSGSYIYLQDNGYVRFGGTTQLGNDNQVANTLSQRNGTNAQTFRVYNTYTSSTNFERVQVGWTTNTFIVGTEKGSAGGSPRQLELQTDGTTRVAITTTGLVGIGSTQPTATLDVNGDVNITGIVTATKFVGEVEIINPFLLMGA